MSNSATEKKQIKEEKFVRNANNLVAGRMTLLFELAREAADKDNNRVDKSHKVPQTVRAD